MSNKLLRLADRRRLELAFHQGFDRSSAEQALLHLGESQFERLPAGTEPVGEGTHFRAYMIKPRSGALPLCLKIAKPEFIKGMGTVGMERWAQGISTLSTAASAELIPPMIVLRVKVQTRGPKEDLWGLAMPYGTAELSAASSHWEPLSQVLDETQIWLRKAGYEIDDLLQGRTWQGIPFLIDFSDLKRR